MQISANDPNRKSWIVVDANSDFPIQNLPFGIYSTEEKSARVGVAIGEHIVDVYALTQAGLINLKEISNPEVFNRCVLNDFMALGKEATRALRNRLSELLMEGNDELSGNAELIEAVLDHQSDAEMHLPVRIGDYTDFYSSKEHATNVGTMFRDPNNALLPNWLYIPVGYHGRSSSIIKSGTPIHRPKGQQKLNDTDPPVFGPCRLLDFELEMGFFTYQGKPLGDSISVAEAEDYIFGMCMFNDWSARDIQKWEYVPLGPFLAKNFASTVSPWIITMDALEPARTATPTQDPAPLEYLRFEGEKSFDIQLEVGIAPEGSEETTVCKSNYKYMYWNMSQQLAHHSVNGCNINCGDLLASGTISGPTEDSFGSMLELSWKGTKEIPMKDGSIRKFIQDGDTVIMRGFAYNNGIKMGFGDTVNKILPAK